MISCGPHKAPWQEADVGLIPDPGLTINRYEQALFSVDTTRMAAEIADMTGTYAVFLGDVPPDSSGIHQLIRYISDPFIQQLYQKTLEVFPGVVEQENELNEAFRYYSYYFPDQGIPKVFTYISGIDYEHPVLFQPSAMLIALDMYLGQDYEPYMQLGLPSYMIRRSSKEYLVRDCIREVAVYHMQDQYPGDNVLDKMIFEGKKLYFLDALLPFQPDSVKTGYTGDQVEWCIDNEANLWKFFIENETLYSTDIQIINKFFTDGPFTRGFPDSPARLGSWMGWQIVRTFMEAHPKKSLRDLLAERDSRRILQESGYKPGKN
jgi:hypothetical protein